MVQVFGLQFLEKLGVFNANQASCFILLIECRYVSLHEQTVEEASMRLLGQAHLQLALQL